MSINPNPSLYLLHKDNRINNIGSIAFSNNSGTEQARQGSVNWG